jgi:cyclase
MEKITDRVYARTDIRGCNYGYVITSKGVVVIDTPQLPTKAVGMREEIASKAPLRFLINTEHHIDHIFGNFFFSGLCPVVSSEQAFNDFWMDIRGVNPYQFMMEVIRESDPEGLNLIPPEGQFAVNFPSITFDGSMIIRLGDHTFTLLSTPGHTKGQIAVYVQEEKVLFTGDTIFNHCQTWFHASDPESWIDSLNFISTLDAEYIVPGHGPICNKDYIPKQSAFIREWVAAVAVGIANGWTKEECVMRISFLDRYPMDYGQEKAGQMVQRLNVERIYDFLLGVTERFGRPSFLNRS